MMLSRMNNIDAYMNSSIILMRKTPNKIFSWITVLSLTLMLIIIFMFTFKYKAYLKYESHIKDGNIEFFVDKQFFEKKQNNKVLIKNKNYDYDIISITEFSYEYGKNNLWKIIISADLPDNMLVENNYFQIKFLESEGTIAKRIITKIRRCLNK